MTEHPLRLVRENARTVKPEKAKHELGSMDSAKYAKHLVLFRARPALLNPLLDEARLHIPGMAANSIVQKILAHNPDCVWVIARKSVASVAVSVAVPEAVDLTVKTAWPLASVVPVVVAIVSKPPARLEAMEKRMEAMLQAVKTVRPAFDALDATLSDEQKVLLDDNGYRRRIWRRDR